MQYGYQKMLNFTPISNPLKKFHRFEISVKVCVFDTFIDFLPNKIFLGHISTFLKQWSKTRKKWFRKSKILNHPRGLRSSFSKKSKIRCTLMYSVRWIAELISCRILRNNDTRNRGLVLLRKNWLRISQIHNF
jgi:hypothetical protein